MRLSLFVRGSRYGWDSWNGWLFATKTAFLFSVTMLSDIIQGAGDSSEQKVKFLSCGATNVSERTQAGAMSAYD